MVSTKLAEVESYASNTAPRRRHDAELKAKVLADCDKAKPPTSVPVASGVVAVIRINAVWLAVEPVDMRAGIEALLARVVQVFGAASRTTGTCSPTREARASSCSCTMASACGRSAAIEPGPLHLAAPWHCSAVGADASAVRCAARPAVAAAGANERHHAPVREPSGHRHMPRGRREEGGGGLGSVRVTEWGTRGEGSCRGHAGKARRGGGGGRGEGGWGGRGERLSATRGRVSRRERRHDHEDRGGRGEGGVGEGGGAGRGRVMGGEHESTTGRESGGRDRVDCDETGGGWGNGGVWWEDE